jgi:hypothetical protein
VQEESSWDFLVLRVHYEGMKVCDVVVCAILRLLCYNVCFYKVVMLQYGTIFWE